MNYNIWQAKLAARIHDPAEKALVLLTDPAGHEGGTVRALRDELFDNALWKSLKGIVKQADHWASAADRPQFPQDENNRFAKWAQVRFADKPELVHPLTGETFDLKRLDIDFQQIKAVSGDYFKQLIQYNTTGDVDWQRTLLAFWRFGPELDAEGLKLLWQLLPADTRVPDHTIWSHLDLSSAFAGAMAADQHKTPALLVMSFGPVQSFIAQARSTSDLWAGSHLLSRMLWEGLKVICEQAGPDAVLFPQLHGVPQVDAWLADKLGECGEEKFKDAAWMKQQSDSNPLYAAALPNRFVAIVPADQAARLVADVVQAIHDWVQHQGEAALQKLLQKSEVGDAGYAAAQLQRQLDGFPEAHWLAVPWSLIESNGNAINTDKLESALHQFYPESENRPGFLGGNAWKLLSQELKVDGQRFFKPNGGVLYPALFDLLERANAASKALRPFKQTREEGYRCSLCGEREWLTPDKDDLFYPPDKREARLWQGLPASWSRKGNEQLCGLCTLKRLWPTLFADEVKKITGNEQANRFVVSTHTMALANDLAVCNKEVPEALQEQCRKHLDRNDRVALPARLAAHLHQSNRLDDYAKIPALLDAVRDDEKERKQVEGLVNKWLGHKPEAYYGFILMDGDRMGAWLAGNEPEFQMTYASCWHSQIKVNAAEKARNNTDLDQYLRETRPVSPARHAAISASLNAFALHLTRYAVEEAHHGKLLYAGGDDVMAMIPAGELTSCMLLLRLLYSGAMPEHDADALRQAAKLPEGVKLDQGFVHYKGRLTRLMGKRATASAGAVLAHHSAPLQRVLKELRAAESTAKNKGDRDAFSIRILKRGGGTVSTTTKWFSQATGVKHPILLLQQFAQALGGEKLSRRAAYHAQAWVRDLPSRSLFHEEAMFARMLKANLQRQFKQQHGSENDIVLAGELAALACDAGKGQESEWLEGFLSVAEFIGREVRMGQQSGADHE